MASALPFDTLAYTKKLISACFTPQQAETQAEALADILDDQLVSKEYLDLKLSQTKEDIIKWIAGMLLAQVAIIAALVKLL